MPKFQFLIRSHWESRLVNPWQCDRTPALKQSSHAA